MEAYEIISAVRSGQRPTATLFIERLFDNFIELYGDRSFADDPAIVGGIALLEEMPVTVIAIEKGSSVDERVKRNFGSAKPEGYRKALRLMKQAEKFGRPILTIIDTPGAYSGMEAEERGQGFAISNNLLNMISLKTPILSLFIGEGGSGGALALAVSDEVWILEGAIYSVISPEGAASILWKDSSKADEAANYLKLTSYELGKLKVVDRIIKESGPFYSRLKKDIFKKFTSLLSLESGELVDKRYARFRKY
jgi:acetyl-CoA carboxylase carboxyl transferase subunit alpha